MPTDVPSEEEVEQLCSDLDPGYSARWLEELMVDDHMVTIDHKDEMDLAEIALAARSAIPMLRSLRAALTRAEEKVAEFTKAADGVCAAFDQGVFVRSMTGDSDPAWAVKILPHLQSLGRLEKLRRG